MAECHCAVVRQGGSVSGVIEPVREFDGEVGPETIPEVVVFVKGSRDEEGASFGISALEVERLVERSSHEGTGPCVE